MVQYAYLTIICALLFAAQGNSNCQPDSGYNTIDIKLEISKQQHHEAQDNFFMNNLVMKDLVITGFDKTSFGSSAEDKLHISLNHDTTLISIKDKATNKFQHYKWVNLKDNQFEFQLIDDPHTTVTYSKDDLLHMILQHRVAMKMKHGRRYRTILPLPLEECKKLDNTRKDIKWETHRKFGEHEALIITKFDPNKAGYTLPTLASPHNSLWSNMQPIVSDIRFVLNPEKKNCIYFLERSISRPYFSWQPYFYKKSERSDSKSEKPYVDIFYFLNSNEATKPKTKELYAKDLNDLTRRGMIAFDDNGKYLLSGLTESEYVKSVTDIHKGKEVNAPGIHIVAALSSVRASDGSVSTNPFNAKEYRDMNVYDAIYYDEDYYEDVSRLVKLAKYFGYK